MNRKNPYEENIATKCAVCRQDILIDQYGNGRCNHCGWEQCKDCLDFADKVRYPNLVSFNKARKLFRERKPFIPSFEDFVGMYNFYSEVAFGYKGKRYGVVGLEGKIEFYESPSGAIQIYNSIEEFAAKAHINGILLKDLWHEVENANYMNCG